MTNQATNLGSRLTAEIAAIRDSKIEEARRNEEKEREYRKWKADELSKRTSEIAIELLKDLSDENVKDLIVTHFSALRLGERSAAEIGIDPSARKGAALFVVEHTRTSNPARKAIRPLSGFSYLWEAEEMHAAIRSLAVESRLAELKRSEIGVKFFRRGNRIALAAGSAAYWISISYPSPE